MRIHIPQSSCLTQIFKCFFIVPSKETLVAHLAEFKWIVRLYSFHSILFHFFIGFWSWHSTERTSCVQWFIQSGVTAADANQFAATCHHLTMCWLLAIQRQAADRAFAKVALIGL